MCSVSVVRENVLIGVFCPFWALWGHRPVTDLSRQASLRGGAVPARSRQPGAALLAEDNELRSACPASTESLVACAGFSYACSPGLPHSQDSPSLRSAAHPHRRNGQAHLRCARVLLLRTPMLRFAASCARGIRGRNPEALHALWEVECETRPEEGVAETVSAARIRLCGR